MRRSDPGARSERDAARLALVEGWPVFVTVVVVGLTFGVLARQAGLSIPEIAGFSALVFAGAAQFAMIQLLAGGAPVPLVVGTALLINLRHLLMATSLRSRFVGLPLWRRLALAYFLTDESFAMAAGWYRRGGRGVAYYATFATALFALWNTATLAGALAGAAIGDPRRLGIDFAITATFIGIVVLSVRRRGDAAVALAGAAIAAAVALAGAPSVAVVAAGLVAPLLALRR